MIKFQKNKFKISSLSNKIKKVKDIKIGEITNRKIIYITVILFVAFHMFYPQSNFRVYLKTKQKINRVNSEINHLELQLEQDCVVIKNMKNKKKLIKYAREKLYMTNEREEIYLTK